MKLYTLISIALGVFGGTYAALAALRTHFEWLIKSTAEEAETHLRKISDHYGKQSNTTRCARGRKKWIGRSSALWNVCNTVPAILFAILVFCVAIWVLLNWDTMCAQNDGEAIDRSKSPWPQCHTGLLYLVVVDLGCFLGAAIAWCTCKLTGRVLRQQYDAALEDEKNQIELPPPPPAAVQQV